MNSRKFMEKIMVSKKNRKTFSGRKVSVRRGSRSKMHPEKKGNQTMIYFILNYFKLNYGSIQNVYTQKQPPEVFYKKRPEVCNFIKKETHRFSCVFL